MNTSDLEKLEQAIHAYQKNTPGDRTFKLTSPQGQTLWVKTPSPARLRMLYAMTNQLMVWLNMPYFQAPPHAGGPGGVASLQIEKEMLLRLKAAHIPVPEVVASSAHWLALSAVGEKELDAALNDLPPQQRLALWQQAAKAIAHVHAQGCCLSQCFARNIMLDEVKNEAAHSTGQASYQLYFLDFEEDPTRIMSLSHAQMRDWAMFLHSTATLISSDMKAAQLFLLDLLEKESPQAQKVAQQLFKKLTRLQWLKRLQWLGRDGMRLYHLGGFSAGIDQGLCEKNKIKTYL